jgi:hypothetical protein
MQETMNLSITTDEKIIIVEALQLYFDKNLKKPINPSSKKNTVHKINLQNFRNILNKLG